MKKFIYLLFTVLFFAGCSDSDDNVTLPDVTVNFKSTVVGIDGEYDSERIELVLSRAYSRDLTVQLTYNSEDLVYGEEFTVDPAPSGDNFSLTISAGQTSAGFTVEKNTEAVFDGDEAVEFTIVSLSVSEGVAIGSTNVVKVVFGTIVSAGEDEFTIQARVGDDPTANVVYVDFSTNKQYPVDRSGWDLGFYCGDDFRVILNPSYQTVATSTGKYSMADVTLDDTVDAEYLDGNPMAMGAGEIPLPFDVLDNLSGSLTGTVFNTISSVSSENQVYFVASENNRSDRSRWYKVKVDRNSTADGYIVQYEYVSDSEFKSVEIKKNDLYNIISLSLETGDIVIAEPQAEKWDIMYGYSVQSTPFMGIPRPYFMQDMILINNIGGVTAAQIFEEEIGFDNISVDDLAGIRFSNDRLVIGDSWRSVSAGVYTDRYYVIKDPAGNYYKMQGVRGGFGEDGGIRGNPVIRYYLINE
ncbi:MAG: HmuY family protein [Rikenellaceae bacterium]|nr:HmuY family protein [Rikenellaceae bacterium]